VPIYGRLFASGLGADVPGNLLSLALSSHLEERER
jgi:hypothetical protein